MFLEREKGEKEKGSSKLFTLQAIARLVRGHEIKLLFQVKQ